jgi:hypothetical protein
VRGVPLLPVLARLMRAYPLVHQSSISGCLRELCLIAASVASALPPTRLACPPRLQRSKRCWRCGVRC